MFSNTGVHGFPRVLHQGNPSQKVLCIFMEKGLLSLSNPEDCGGGIPEAARQQCFSTPLAPHTTSLQGNQREKLEPLWTETYCVQGSVPAPTVHLSSTFPASYRVLHSSHKEGNQGIERYRKVIQRPWDKWGNEKGEYRLLWLYLCTL